MKNKDLIDFLARVDALPKRIQNKLYGEFSKSRVKDWLGVKLDKPYISIEGTGSIYNPYTGNSLGYFQRGSILTFKNIFTAESKYMMTNIKGSTFKVVQDSSFGNTPSRTITSLQENTGKHPLSRFPSIIRLDKALEILETI